jgi:protoheme IX farnesyltransferase
MIVFLWTPPHFWALSLYKSDDYAKAGVPMMPVVKGARRTKFEIVTYSFVLTVFSAVAPYALGFATLTYALIAAALGAVFVLLALKVFRMPESDRDMKPARHLFTYSMLYLFLLFAILLVENGVARWAA